MEKFRLERFWLESLRAFHGLLALRMGMRMSPRGNQA